MFFFKNKKIRIIILILAFILISFFCVLCFRGNCKKIMAGDKKINVAASTFLQYDFVKQIVKDKADVFAVLPPGVESHDFEVSAKDIVNVASSDVFLYLGPNVEPWANRIVSNLSKSNTAAVDISGGIKFIKNGNSIDVHIWLDPGNISIMVDNTLSALCEKDEKNSEFYKLNAKIYKEKLLNLDLEIKKAVEASRVKKIVFASKFSSIYFVKKYGLDYIAAYKSCEDEAEPDAGKISEIVNFLKNNKMHAVFYEDNDSLKLANIIASETRSKVFKFNSIHTLNKPEFKNNSESIYLELMEQNLENLKQGLF